MAVTERELGKRLRTARRACGRTQKEVSRTLGISRSTVALIELGQRRVSGLELERLAALYGRSPDSLLSPARTVNEALDRLLTIAPDLAQAGAALEELKRLLRLSREVASLESTLAVGPSSATAPSYDSPLPRTEWEAIQQSLRTAEEERRRLDLGVAPIRDVDQTMSVLSVRTAAVTFPHDVSGVFLSDLSGYLVAVRRTMPLLQRRFMYAHGFAHVLFDRQDHCHVCRAEDRGSLREVRANAFAAAFLMPEAGVRGFLAHLGKGMPSRGTVDVFDVFAEGSEAGATGEPIRVERRRDGRSQRINPYDVSQLAFHFGVSRSLVIHCLRNLRLLTAMEVESLLAGAQLVEGAGLVATLQLGDGPGGGERDLLRDRILILGLEALRRRATTWDRLIELAGMVGLGVEQVRWLVHALVSQGVPRKRTGRGWSTEGVSRPHPAKASD